MHVGVEDGIVQAILMGIFFSGDGVLLLIRIFKNGKENLRQWAADEAVFICVYFSVCVAV